MQPIEHIMPYAHFFSYLTSNIEILISKGGYILLFICTILEGVPVVGMVIPGHIAIIVAGFLAKIGTLNLYWVMLIASVGAIMGDFIGYSIGRRYGMSFIDWIRPYIFITDNHIEKAQNLLARHTGKAMVIGRFTPATRALLPFLVGASKTPATKFWIFNVIGGASWAISSVLLGYIFGAAYHLVAGYLGRFVVAAILLAVIIIWGYRFVNMRFHIFRRYELFTLILNILSLWALAGMIEELADSSFKLGFDIWVNAMMVNLHNTLPVLTTVALWVTTIGGTAVTGILGLLIGIYFFIRRKWRSSTIMLLSIGSAGIMLGLMKQFFDVTRPDNALSHIVNDPSFPSGHAGMAAAFFVALAYLLAPKIHSWIKRELMLVACILAIIAIGLSRLVLNVHWASDVVAGWALGVFMATASILFVRYVGVLLTRRDVKKLSTGNNKA